MSTNEEQGPLRERQNRAGDSSLFQAFYRESWANPLDPSLTALTAQTVDISDDEVGTDDDVLPGEPLLVVLETHILVRAEYIRVFDAVELLYSESHKDHLAVVTGQPGIGAWISIVIFVTDLSSRKFRGSSCCNISRQELQEGLGSRGGQCDRCNVRNHSLLIRFYLTVLFRICISENGYNDNELSVETLDFFDKKTAAKADGR